MFADVVCDILYAIFVHLPVLLVVGDQCGQTVLALQLSDALMQNLNLLGNKVTDINSLLPIINLKLLILAKCLIHQLLLIVLKQEIDLLKNLLLVLNQLVMYTLSQSHNIVIDIVIALTQLLKHHDVLVAFLLCVVDRFEDVDIGGFVVLDEVLLGMFNDAVGAEGHEALCIAAEIGEKFCGMVRAEYFFDLCVWGDGGLLYP